MASFPQKLGPSKPLRGQKFDPSNGKATKRRNKDGGFLSLGGAQEQFIRLNAKLTVLQRSLEHGDLSFKQRRVKEDLLRKGVYRLQSIGQAIADGLNNPKPIVDIDRQGDKVNATDRLYPVRVKQVRRFSLTK